jgi:hypothetical protein
MALQEALVFTEEKNKIVHFFRDSVELFECESGYLCYTI